jgi:hypothetical protein
MNARLNNIQNEAERQLCPTKFVVGRTLLRRPDSTLQISYPANRPLVRRKTLAVTKTSIATQSVTSKPRRVAAVPMVTPSPVARATHAATQAGHFGRNNSVAPATSQPASSPPKRHRDLHPGLPAPVQARDSVRQQGVFMRVLPKLRNRKL